MRGRIGTAEGSIIRVGYRKPVFPGAGAASRADPVQPQRISLAFNNNPESHHYAFLLARLDRKDSCPEEFVPHPLDECGIAKLTHDLLIHRSCALGVHRFARYHSSVDGEREIFERSTLGQGQQVIGFSHPTTPIHVRLRHLVAHNATIQVRAHATRRPHHLR